MASPLPRPADKVLIRDTIHLPCTPGKVYEVRLMPGAPFALELPPGESARNIWVDNRWWKAESTPGSSRVFLRALGTEDVVGRRGFIHVETEPSDYRISLKVVGVPETADVSPGLAIYVEGSALNDPVRLQARKLADRELLYIQHREQEKARADVEAWRKNLLQNVRADYERGALEHELVRMSGSGQTEEQALVRIPGQHQLVVLALLAGEAQQASAHGGTDVRARSLLHASASRYGRMNG